MTCPNCTNSDKSSMEVISTSTDGKNKLVFCNVCSKTFVIKGK